MKKTIGDTIYDTSKALLVFELENETVGGSFVFAELFRMPNSMYICHTWGTLPDQVETWEAGTKDDAMVWSYGAMSCEKFEGEFGIDPESYAEKVGMEHLCLSRWPSMG